MLFAHTYTPKRTVAADVELTQANVRAFRARVGLALAASDAVVLDLTHTDRFDSWALLAILDLVETFSPRLTLNAPDYLCESLARIDPHVPLGRAIS